MTNFTNRHFILFLIVFFGASYSGFSQAGCTDPNANNYNPGATTNDGSCTYNTTLYNPPVKVDPMNSILTENSGLQWAGGWLWTFNDSGGEAALYRIDTVTNAILQTVHLTGTTNVDWEDIAFDGTDFYMGDFGNNNDGARTDLKIYKFPLSAIPDNTTNPIASIPSNLVKIINFKYADQPQPPAVTTLNNTKFDCEAMIIADGTIHLFTKNWIDVTTTHYQINSLDEGSYTAANIETLNTGFLVTAADKVEGKNIIVLLGYQVTLPGNHFLSLLTDYTGTNYFSGNKRQINLPNALAMGQAEGIAFRNDSYGYLSNERVDYQGFNITQKLKSFNINNFIPPSLLAVQLKQFNVTDINGTHKIAWDFVSPVNDLNLQTSVNGSTFSNIKSLGISKTGTAYNTPGRPATFYRLNWKDEGQANNYSPIVEVKGQQKDGVKMLNLSKTGRFNFIVGGLSAQKIGFRIMSTHGKTLSVFPARSYLPGLSTVRFENLSINTGLVYITTITGNLKTTSLVNITD